jgi:Ca2+-binding EF-hand superfamily protein
MAPPGSTPASWHQAPRQPPQTQRFYKKQASRERDANLRDQQLIALHEQRRKQRRDRVLAPKRPVSAPARGGPELDSQESAAGALEDDGASPQPPARRHRRQVVARRPMKRRGVADLAKKEQFKLSTEERLQRQSDQISNVINQLIRGRRQLYGTMMRDAESTFKAIDKDGSGALDYTEFSSAMKRLGLGLREDQCMELARAMDADGDGEIDCAEFVSALKEAEKRAADAKNLEFVEEVEETEAQPEPEPELEPEPEIQEVAAPEPSVAEMTPKQCTDMLFKAVLSEDEATITRLLDGGVPIDVKRTDRLTMKDETPMDVAVAEGKALSVATLQAHITVGQQQLVCMGLMAKHAAIKSFASKLQHDHFGFKKRSVVALRPWRNAKAVDSCTDQLTELNPSHKAEVARVLTRRAKLYIDVHAMANAVADYSAVLALCPIDPAIEEYDDLKISTLVRRGVVRHFSNQDHLALVDLEKGWQLFRAKRESLRVMGEIVHPSPLLDKAAHLIHTIRFRLRMEEIDQRERRVLPAVTDATDTKEPASDVAPTSEVEPTSDAGPTPAPAPAPAEERTWASAVKAVQDAETLGVNLIWLVEWGIRNEIPGYAEAFSKSEKGKRTIAGVQKAKNCQHFSARKAVMAVVESHVLGPLRPGLEGRVVNANRHNRVFVNCTGGRQFWYSCADLKQLPLTHADIKKRFDAIDEDGSGVLDRGEVAQVAASLGAELNDKQLNEAMEAMDHDGSGEVSLPEFITWYEHEQQDQAKGKVKKAAYLTFSKDDRVSLKPEAAARLKAQCKLPSVHERACAWIEDHKDDDDFDVPTVQHPLTTAQLVDTIIKPATQRSKQSYANEYLSRPVLQKATHYVVHDPEDGFWDVVHGLLLHQLGLDQSVELRELTADQMLGALQLHCTKRGSLFNYTFDWLICPVVTPPGKTDEEFMLLRKAVEKRAIADAGYMVLSMQSAVETPNILKDPVLLKTICTGMEIGAEVNLTLSFSALGELSLLLWAQLADTKRKKNALSVVYGGSTVGEEAVDTEAIDEQLANSLLLSLSLRAVDEDESSESSLMSEQRRQLGEKQQQQPPPHPLASWRSRRRPLDAPAVRRKEKELLTIQAERSEMRVSLATLSSP